MRARSKSVLLLLLAFLATTACGQRRDIAELAAGIEPFDQLAGTNIATLRGGQVRAMRSKIQPSPLEGYRERLGDWDIVYTSQGFDGTDGSWPQEEVQILEVEATRQVASDSAGMLLWYDTAKKIRNETGATPKCLMVYGSGFSLYVVEFDRGGDWRLAVSYAPAVRLTNRERLSSRVAVAVRRMSLSERFPERGQPNPDSLPTWTREEEECSFQ